MIRQAVLCLSAALTSLLGVAGVAHGETPAVLVRDLRHQGGPNLSSNPSGMISLGAQALFWARTPSLGSELYRTDGTVAGTSLLADLCPGPCDSVGFQEPVSIPGRAFFIANDGARGSELWTSTGTVAGTRQVVDLTPGPGEGVYLFLKSAGDRALFGTFGPGLRGWDLWTTNGSAARTGRFARLLGGAGGGLVVPPGAIVPQPLPGGRHLYLKNFRVDGIEELWESDGTAAGTHRVLTLQRELGESICSDGSDLPRVIAGDFYFSAATAATGCELWRVSGGVAAPFADLLPGVPSSSPRSFVRQGAWTLFVVDREDSTSVLWTTDGTLARTLPADRSGPAVGTSPSYLGSNSLGAYYAATTDEAGRELWIAHGPPGTFNLLADLVPNAGSSDPTPAGMARDRVFFWTSRPDRGIELMAASLIDIQTVLRARERGEEGAFAAAGDQAVFGADLGRGFGVELAVSNGYRGHSGLLRDLAQGDPSSDPAQLTEVAGHVLFVATDDTHGREVWRSDGTLAGTGLVADLAPPGLFYGPSFLASTATGVVIDAPDGSIRHAAADRGGADLLFRPASEVKGASQGFTLGGQALFFAPVGEADRPRFELWRSDGRPGGSRRLAEIAEFDRFFLYGVRSAVDAAHRRAFFIPITASDETGRTNEGLWVTDGTASGTRRAVADPCDRCSGFITDPIIGPDDRFFYVADEFRDDISQLWASDGTSGGTEKLAESPGRVDGSPIRSLARLGDLLLFAASDPQHGQELWVSDGSVAGTRRLADLRFGSGSSWPDGLTTVGDRVFFSADDGSRGRELWATDGTEAGTYLVSDLRVGVRSSVPQSLTAIGNRLVFAADDGRHGLEVWSSDGTSEGTRLASDVQVGRLPSSPSDFVALGSDLLFVASRLSTGRELFRLPLAALKP